MKVDDAMLERAVHAYHAMAEVDHHARLRRALNAAVAEAPEPSEGVADLVRRLTRAQMKLQRIRELRLADTELRRILEEDA